MMHCDGALKDGHALRVLIEDSFDILQCPERILVAINSRAMAVIQPLTVGKKTVPIFGCFEKIDLSKIK